jgi:hypothetical protein
MAKACLFFASVLVAALSRSFLVKPTFLLSGREMIKISPGKECIVLCNLTGLENMGVLLFFLLTIWSLCNRASLMSRMQKQNFFNSFFYTMLVNVTQRRHDLTNILTVATVAVTIDF